MVMWVAVHMGIKAHFLCREICRDLVFVEFVKLGGMVVEDGFSDRHGLVDATIKTCDSKISSLLQFAAAFAR